MPIGSLVRRTFFIALAFIVLMDAEQSAMAVQQPSYKIELDAKPFQIRLYAPMIIAAVHFQGNRNDAVSAGFRILADYIFGNNQKNDKIAMTAPVTQSAGEKIAMTAPVNQSQTRNGWMVNFIMPAGTTIDTLPKPKDGRIEIDQMAARHVAVVRFSGFWSDSNFKMHEAELMDFLKRKELTPVSAPIYAYYDPPWTPWFLRTNEVQIEIAP